ncbi:NADPH-dependent F420 reductase [Actinomadura sp. WMMB 499]|uniref:NADPH-dependent F420 reductase n=1 Tax=Actinomadura sp. WMMB 499 TaxID=1219491 RepID=UPI001246B96C|nr:NAD(P)-binding domain-containing protein [Actinomadura sp. WMMB 499]QFG22728.1 NADP oxidoreductase [Actinomadura sp. WMMB 499]
MKIAVFGTGDVGRCLATRLAGLGHDVVLGSRTADNPAAAAWAAEHGGRHGTFADAAAHGELVVNATGGTVSLDALTAAGAANLDGKVVLDVSNPLDFSGGFPPALAVPAEGSVAEQLQGAFPGARVVKALNTMHNALMVDPSRVDGPHNVFVCGDDDGAKADVAGLLRSFGWTGERILDLGGLAAARELESLVLLWVRLSGVLGTADLNFAILR